jgi:hypothetical protein
MKRNDAATLRCSIGFQVVPKAIAISYTGMGGHRLKAYATLVSAGTAI